MESTSEFCVSLPVGGRSRGKSVVGRSRKSRRRVASRRDSQPQPPSIMASQDSSSSHVIDLVDGAGAKSSNNASPMPPTASQSSLGKAQCSIDVDDDLAGPFARFPYQGELEDPYVEELTRDNAFKEGIVPLSPIMAY